MKQYIYGEVFIKTNKNLYCIKSYNMIHDSKIINDYYIAVKSYSHQLGKTDSFTSVDGNNHISILRDNKSILFNSINKKTRLYKALHKRLYK